MEAGVGRCALWTWALCFRAERHTHSQSSCVWDCRKPAAQLTADWLSAVSSHGCLESWPTYQLKWGAQVVWRPLVVWGQHAAAVQRCWRLNLTGFSLRLPFHVSLRAVNWPNWAQCWSLLLAACGQLTRSVTMETVQCRAVRRPQQLGGDGERSNTLWQQQNCGGGSFCTQLCVQLAGHTRQSETTSGVSVSAAGLPSAHHSFIIYSWFVNRHKLANSFSTTR